MKRTKETIPELIEAIETKLDNIEDMMAWLIKSESRFCVGQRVKLSAKATERSGFKAYKGSIKGTVTKLDGFSVEVKRDHQKHSKGWHHMFWEAV